MASTHHLILYVLLPLLPLLAVAGGGGGCRAGDASSLLAFKNALSDPDGHLVSWSAAVDCCSWSHVSCDATGVASLGLAGLGLGLSSSDKDALAPLAGLTNLVSLDLSNNYFGLPIPAGIFPHIPRLTHLNLSMSGFNGSVPPDLGKARMLVSLDLSSNFWLTVEDGRFLADLPEMEELYLDRVNLSMAFPGKSCRALSSWLPKLRVVSLNHCSIVNCSLETLLSNLTSITHLDLGWNDFSSSPIPAFLSDFRTLSVLSLAGCGLEGEFPAGIFQLKWLKILDVSSNPGLSGKLLEFPKGSALEKLVLSDTNFAGELPASIGNLAHLAILRLSYARFSGALPEDIGKMVRLTRLQLSSNNFVGRIPSLAQLKSLVNLDLSSNGFQGCFPHVADSLPGERFDIIGNNSLPGTIDLSGNRIQEEFPRSIFQLSQLQVLKLSFNNFSGIVQLDWFGGMPHLSRLELSHCGLSVHIENDSHSNFQQFLVLKLASCNLTRIPEFLQKQTSLSELDLSENRISGDIPNWIWNSESLWFLNLSSNLLTGLQHNISSKYLRVLDLSGNSFHSTFPLDIGTNLSTSIVSLSRNNLIGSIPSSICEVYMDVLDLSENNLNGSIPSCLPSDLGVLNLRENSISGAIPDAFQNDCSLKILDLYENKIQGRMPTSLKNCRQLVVLNLGNNGIEGTFPSWLGELPHLQILVLRSNRLQGLVQPFFGGFERLQIMDLSSNSFSGNLCSSCFNSISGVIPDALSKGCSLKTLDLYGNKIVGQIPTSLKYCRHLVVLNLGNNSIEGTFPSWLGELPYLQILVLRSNRLRGRVEPFLGGFQQLQIMDLSSNSFSGNLCSSCFNSWKSMITSENKQSHDQVIEFEISFNTTESLPPYFDTLILTSKGSELHYRDTLTLTIKGSELKLEKILTALVVIDLSNNNFEGFIPETIGNLRLLHLLNLSHNALANTIPRSIGNLSQLESLDLSWNKLTGEIPQEMVNLTFLSVLNLSSNQLVGKIPQGPQMNTLSSYLDNAGLCGLPLPNSCEHDDESWILHHPSEYATSSKSHNLNDWTWISAEIGFIFGFGVTWLPLVFCRRWWILYFTYVDSFLWRIPFIYRLLLS